MSGERPERKNMRLERYNYGSDGVYFVTICTQRKQKMLSNLVGGDAHIAPQVQLTECGKIVQTYIESTNTAYQGVKVLNYVIMPNHIHLLIGLGRGAMWASPPTETVGVEAASKSLPHIMRSLKTLSVKAWGAPIWQETYYDHIVRNEEDFWPIWKYIDENPLKWADDEYYN